MLAIADRCCVVAGSAPTSKPGRPPPVPRAPHLSEARRCRADRDRHENAMKLNLMERLLTLLVVRKLLSGAQSDIPKAALRLQSKRAGSMLYVQPGCIAHPPIRRSIRTAGHLGGVFVPPPRAAMPAATGPHLARTWLPAWAEAGTAVAYHPPRLAVSGEAGRVVGHHPPRLAVRTEDGRTVGSHRPRRLAA
jgi:hypothetical protein